MPEHSQTPDDALTVVQGWCADAGAALVFGFVEDSGNVPRVLVHEDVTDLRSFLDLARRLGSVAVFADVSRLEEATWIERREELGREIEALEQDEGSHEGELQEARDTLAQVHGCESCVGSVAAIELRCFAANPTVVLHWDHFAEWFDLFFSSDEDSGEDDVDWAKDRAERDAAEQVRQEWCDAAARELSQVPEFQRLRNRDQRKYLARQQLSARDGWDPQFLSRIVHAATTIYETELRPIQEADLKRQATVLRDQGVPLKDVAVKLDMSLDRLKRLLG